MDEINRGRLDTTALIGVYVGILVGKGVRLPERSELAALIGDVAVAIEDAVTNADLDDVVSAWDGINWYDVCQTAADEILKGGDRSAGAIAAYAVSRNTDDKETE